MRCFFLLLAFILLSGLGFSQLSVNIVGALPEPVSNNAQCEGFFNGTPYIYSFGGIDSSKTYQGIHLRSYRYNTITNVASQLPDLPDTLGKIAAGASRIGNIIYIAGGYHVLQNGSELSSNKLHRFNITTNTFMTDGAAIPQATDDHVQVVWRDSLLILITGWKNTGNIPDVQIYDPSSNTWSVGTPVPNNQIYKSFGASGAILGDTIYYFGGARSSFGFNIQNAVRKGVINPADPTQITWSFEVIDPSTVGYRMAATTVGETLHWLGGSAVTYNYDGIAYNGSGGVPPTNRDLYTNAGLGNWQSDLVNELPMDLRGIANINDSLKYIAGGMTDNQMVTNKVYELQWDLSFLGVDKVNKISVPKFFPQPFSSHLTIDLSMMQNLPAILYLYDISGKLVHVEQLNTAINELVLDALKAGIYIAKINVGDQVFTQKVVKSAF